MGFEKNKLPLLLFGFILNEKFKNLESDV